MRALAFASLCLAACGSSPTSPDATSADATPDAYVNQLSVSGTVADRKTGTLIASATICAAGAPGNPCTSSALDGTYSLSVPILDGPSQLANVTTADGYLGSELEVVEDPTPSNGHALHWESTGLYASADATTLLATQAGFTYPTTTTGFVQIQIFGAPQGSAPAATATIASLPGAVVVYGDADGTPDPALTATTPGNVGDIYFGNLAPGTYDVTVASPGKTCTATSGGSTINGEWPPTVGGTVSVGVTANALTSLLSIDCS